MLNLPFLRKSCSHSYIPHFTGNRIQIGAESLIGKEVDYYYCENCGIKDPTRKSYPDSERKQLEKFYTKR